MIGNRYDLVLFTWQQNIEEHKNTTMKVIEFALFWMSATSHLEQNTFQYDADSITGELQSLTSVSKYIGNNCFGAPALIQ